MKYIVDAHPLLWFLAGSPRLGTNARSVMLNPASELVVPAIAYAEACWIAEHGKVPPLTAQRIRDVIDADSRFVGHPLDKAVVERSQSLTAINEMHDRQIIATALVLADAGEIVTVLTRDANMIKSSLVAILW